MDRRLDLHQKLETVVGCKRVHFQPPPTIKLNYPCIVYAQSNGNTKFAANMPYTFVKKYNVTLMDRNPDSSFVREIAMSFPRCVMDRAYTADGIHHYVFTIYH